MSSTAAAAAPDPAERITAAAAGLPVGYDLDPGHGGDGKPRKARKMRRDMADYLQAVRRHDAATADFFGGYLQAVPTAWCSYWLPTHTPAQWEAWLAAAESRRAHVVAALGITPSDSTLTTPLMTPAQKSLLRFARGLAAKMFCPDQLKHAGNGPRSVADAAKLPKIRSGCCVDRTESTLPGRIFASDNSYGGADSFLVKEAAAAYLFIIGLTPPGWLQRPIILDDEHGCGVSAALLDGRQDAEAIEEELDRQRRGALPTYRLYVEHMDQHWMEARITFDLADCPQRLPT